MNSTSAITNLINPSLPLQYTIILPEYFSTIALTIIIRGMYKGVEIGHPLFAVLFMSIIVTALSSALNIVAFVKLPFQKFILFFNFANIISLVFHLSSWCVASIIRYLYLNKEDWLFKTFPSQKTQRHIAMLASVVFSLLHILPIICVLIVFGKFLIAAKTIKYVLPSLH